MKKKESVLRDKSYKFAIRIVRLSQYLKQEKKEFDLADTSQAAKISIIAKARSDKELLLEPKLTLNAITTAKTTANPNKINFFLFIIIKF